MILLKHSFKNIFRNAFVVRNADEDAGAQGAAPGGDAETIETPAIDPDSNIPEDFAAVAAQNDPDFAEHVKSKNDKSGAEEDRDDSPGDDASGETDAGTGKDADEKPNADEKNSGKQSGDELDEFADNVIEGLRGEDLKTLPEEAQAAIGKFYQKHEEVSGKLASTEERLNRLLNDPVVKVRADAIDSGNAEKMNVRGLTETERGSIAKTFADEFGLDSDEAKRAVKLLERGIEAAAKEMAHDFAQKHIVQSDNQRKATETIEKGQKLILGLSEFNPDLAVEEKNIGAFYLRGPDGKPVLNEQHPESAKFKSGLGKVIDWCARMGLSYDRLVEMGPKAVYAASAAALDMPVALNTGDRDKKILAAARRSALKPFLKKGPGEAQPLSAKGQAGTEERRVAESVLMDGGYDVVRLANDPGYYESAIARRYGDMAWKEKIDSMVEKGRSVSSKKK